MTVSAGRVLLACGAAIASRRAAWIVALALVLTACRLPYVPGVTSPPPAAVTDLVDARGRVVGRAVFLQQRAGVRILIDLTDVAPGVRAVHLHEVGRCDPPSFESAGPHLNPTRAEHGSANSRGPHAGDLPNITVDASRRGHLEVTATRVTLEKGPASLLDADGSALVVHEAPDDMRTDPDGKSGARIACGVIVRAG
jgi:Cu-Zn family superoxide dismutase